jgi:hypothetical protein
MASYLIKASSPMRLKDAPGGERALLGGRTPAVAEQARTRGKIVFAENCARCHSSKLPSPTPGLGETPACAGAKYLECWDRYWQWTQTEDFKARMRQMVLEPAFLENNYLSTDARIPVTLLETEVCSSMSSNAIAGHIWDNFSSESYKQLPAVGTLTLEDPVTGVKVQWPAPGGGRGYQRVPSLISVWATAPFLHNNEVGIFTSDPSVPGRLRAFDDSIRKLLHLKPRENVIRRTRPWAVEEPSYGKPSSPAYGKSAAAGYETLDGNRSATSNAKGCAGTTWLTLYVSSLPPVPQFLLGDGAIPRAVRGVAGLGSLVSDGMLRIGPIPPGTPVNLLANLNFDRGDPRFSTLKLLKLLDETKKRLKRIEDESLGCEQATAVLKDLVPRLLELSICPDFIVDRGHNFGRDLSADDKEALIEFVKTF